jgi:hypothetical protein
MDFKKATEELMAGMTRGEIADSLGVSEASVRQARLDVTAEAYRTPPKGWEAKVAKMARQRADRLNRLADKLSA